MIWCRNEFSCHAWWDVVSGHSSNGNFSQILRRVFQVRELPVYFQEALLSRKSPIHGRTPLPLLLLAGRRWLSVPSQDFSTSSRSPSPLSSGLSRWPSACLLRNLPLLRRWIECTSVFLLEVKIFPGKFPRISAGASLLSFQSLLEICPQIS